MRDWDPRSSVELAAAGMAALDPDPEEQDAYAAGHAEGMAEGLVLGAEGEYDDATGDKDLP